MRKLNSTELKQLDLFLRSPYFFDGKPPPAAVIQLFEYLRPLHPGFDAALLDKERLQRSVFANEKLIKGKLEKTMSALQKVIEQFIVQQHPARNQDSEQLKVLLQFYREKQMMGAFQKTLKKFQRQQSKATQKGSDFYWDDFQLELEASHAAALHNISKSDLNLPQAIQSLDIYYIVQRLELANKLLAQHVYQRPLFVEEQLDLVYTLLPLIQAHNFFGAPLIELYVAAFLLLSTEAEEHYQKLESLIDAHGQHIPPPQLKPLLAYCRNYCTRQYNKGKSEYLDQAFQLYQKHLQEDYLYYEGGLPARTFKTIADMGMRLGQYDWVRHFLDAYRQKISGTSHPAEVYQYNLAQYFFATQHFDEALNCLPDSYEDLYYKIDARRLEIKIYYEKQSVLLEPRLNAFRVLILRLPKASLPSVHRKGNENFTKILLQILHSATPGNEKRIERLIQRINGKTSIADK
ncbi:MAG: hypothetical protein AAF990_27075, partial [Bacteroidota bacterium]